MKQKGSIRVENITFFYTVHENWRRNCMLLFFSANCEVGLC